MTFDADGQTLGGVSAAEAAARLAGLDVAAVGANHGAGPAAALNALAAMQRDGLVLAALPNVGLASLAGSRVVFPHATPDYFAEFAAQARRLGARDHRRLLRHDAGSDRRDPHRDRRGARAGCAARRPRAPARRARRRRQPRRRSSRGCSASSEFVVSVQLDPPLGANNRALIEAGRALKESGKAHFVDVNDNPRAARADERDHGLGRDRAGGGIETIPHLTPRDMSVAGLESLLLGAHAEGVRNMLAVTGDPPEEGDYPGARGVYEVDAIGLTRLDRRPEPRRGLPRPRRSTRRRPSSSASPSTRPRTTWISSSSGSSASWRRARSSR